MRVALSSKDVSEQQVDVAAFFAHERQKTPAGIANERLRAELTRLIKAESFKARAGDQLSWNPDGQFGARRVLVIGLGPDPQACGEAIRMGAARAARAAGSYSARSLALQLPPDCEPSLAARAVAEGAILGAYQFDRHLTDASRRQVRLESITIAIDRPTAAARRAVALGELGARAVCLARDLGNEGPSDLGPPELARVAARTARAAGLACKILGPAELRRVGMRSLLAVARGSGRPARVVHLTYRPPGVRSPRRIVIVGKGVTFDSGGLNLKPGDGMLTMKSDMSGAGAVLAVMAALPRIGCRAEVHGFMGLVENMTGPLAFKPGDILRSYSGKTIEVGNTDAEGRLVLCDVLAYAAERVKPDMMVDVATLTGACVVALGPRVVGLFTRHAELRDALLAAGTAAGEKLWQLPLVEEYLELLQRGPADLCNVGGRHGGAITAALFLGEFVPRNLPWAHLDIAGPAFTDRELPDAARGATGVGVLTLLRWLERA